MAFRPRICAGLSFRQSKSSAYPFNSALARVPVKTLIFKIITYQGLKRITRLELVFWIWKTHALPIKLYSRKSKRRDLNSRQINCESLENFCFRPLSHSSKCFLNRTNKTMLWQSIKSHKNSTCKQKPT